MSSLAPLRRIGLAALACLLVLCGAAGCGGDKKGLDDPSRQPRTINVPKDVSTIAKAAAVAVPGDLILVSPGTYKESVTITTPRVVLRGLSRSGVVLDGGGTLTDGIRVTGDGVAVENLTVRDYTTNGLIFSGSRPAGAPASTPLQTLVGYRASYITAVGNGLYGVYAFAARRGLFDNIYASGSPDAGIYVGQCKPCDAIVRNSIAEYNAIGYEGTNAGGRLYIVSSIFRHNQVGLTSNSEDKEELAPQTAATFAGNLIHDNGDPAAPNLAEGGYGVGLVIGGGTLNRIDHNRVVDNPVGGIVITDLDQYRPRANRIEDNVLSGNGVDLVYGWQSEAPEAADNCFTGNTFETSKPADIEAVLPCGVTPRSGDLAQIGFPEAPRSSPKVPAPPADLPQLPDPATAPARPANTPEPRIDMSKVTTPAAP